MAVAPINTQGVSTVTGGTGVGVTGGVAGASGSAMVQAAKILNGIVGDLFRRGAQTKAADVETGGALSSPLETIGKKLVQQYAPQLSDLTGGELAGKINVYRGGTAPRPLGGTASTRSAATAATVTPVSFADRGLSQNLAAVFSATGFQPPAGFAEALSNLSSLTSGIASSSSAATGTLAQAATAATQGGDFESGIIGLIQGPPPIPGNVKDERAMLEYQRAMQLYTALVQMVTQVMQMLHEARKNIIQNLRA